MTLRLGNTTINKMYLGGTEVRKAYLGVNLVFDTTGGGGTPSAALDAVAANFSANAIVASFSRRLLSTSSSPLFRVIRADQTTYDVQPLSDHGADIAGLNAFRGTSALEVVGFYNQLSGALIATTTPQDRPYIHNGSSYAVDGQGHLSVGSDLDSGDFIDFNYPNVKSFIASYAQSADFINTLLASQSDFALIAHRNNRTEFGATCTWYQNGTLQGTGTTISATPAENTTVVSYFHFTTPTPTTGLLGDVTRFDGHCFAGKVGEFVMDSNDLSSIRAALEAALNRGYY